MGFNDPKRGAKEWRNPDACICRFGKSREAQPGWPQGNLSAEVDGPTLERGELLLETLREIASSGGDGGLADQLDGRAVLPLGTLEFKGQLQTHPIACLDAEVSA